MSCCLELGVAYSIFLPLRTMERMASARESTDPVSILRAPNCRERSQAVPAQPLPPRPCCSRRGSGTPSRPSQWTRQSAHAIWTCNNDACTIHGKPALSISVQCRAKQYISLPIFQLVYITTVDTSLEAGWTGIFPRYMLVTNCCVTLFFPYDLM